ncbi:MAG: UDP-N-acetylglucosamine 2-epimerase (hydrolyzing) [Deltaproteobacteria bacterium]|nr:UDP-N-acetylglucosamine 2-epimerase (hydrolyzing) [Deltaproteobacteria bacterium]MBW2119200.1 UDP-N-acetylglucosamine 2-epimerase (hydrolyzing) [Deltaproteobacteria bacterium]MBW2342559.1 UDP-N-acetylglucosamine 2-epimerase (hydrolyzing) [Deltaproteobacteria bacterium]
MKNGNKKRRVCVVVNSRANYGRIKSVLQAVREKDDLELKLIVGASALLYRFGEVNKVLKADGFEANATVYSIVEGETPTTMAKSTGMAIMELATQFENLKPDVVITVADRFETMATAVAASYMNIPLAHTQGGEVTGSIDESVRHAVTKLSHLHFAATERAKEYVIRMGEDPATVHCTGCPAIDVIANIDLSLPEDIFVRYMGVGPDIDPEKPYIVVLQHPVTTEWKQGQRQIEETLYAIEAMGIQTVWLWPNVDAGSDKVSKGLRMFREEKKPDYIHFYRNFAVEDYARVINNAACIAGNSSSGLREGSFLGTPVVDIGNRQANREHGKNVVHVDYDAKLIEKAVRGQMENGRYERSTLYGDGRAGKRIATILSECDIKIQKSLFYPKLK